MLKIKYHYEFPNLPINDNDIQSLYEKMTDILWSAESYILELNHQEMCLPDIFISDEIMTETYGKDNSKITTPLLGKYCHERNRIVLYINTIIDYFSNAPCEDAALKIKTGLEIVLANEVFQAIHFHMIGYNNQNRIDNWNVSPQHNAFRNSVVEGLAKWFEYAWCDENQYDNEIYAWHKTNIEEKLSSYNYPDWPYAAAKVFIKDGKSLIDEPIMVLNTLSEAVLMQSNNHWHDAYEVMRNLDPHNKNIILIDEIGKNPNDLLN